MKQTNNSSKRVTTVAIGSHAEKEALSYLEAKGYRLLVANFRSRFGEIDLIMMKENTVVFVEVRYRKNIDRGTPAESVTPRKVRRIIRTAEYFLMKNQQLRDMDFRFDVISITEKLEWTQSAFTLD